MTVLLSAVGNALGSKVEFITIYIKKTFFFDIMEQNAFEDNDIRERLMGFDYIVKVGNRLVAAQPHLLVLVDIIEEIQDLAGQEFSFLI